MANFLSSTRIPAALLATTVGLTACGTGQYRPGTYVQYGAGAGHGHVQRDSGQCSVGFTPMLDFMDTFEYNGIRHDASMAADGLSLVDYSSRDYGRILGTSEPNPQQIRRLAERFKTEQTFCTATMLIEEPTVNYYW